MLSGGQARGFSLIELMVAVSIIAILMALAVPNFTTWIRNARVRTVAEALQASVRLAQAEALRRTQTVVFFRTDSVECTDTAKATASGAYWQIRSVANAATGASMERVQCGVLTDVSTGVRLSSQFIGSNGVAVPTAALCFGGDGRQTTVIDPGDIDMDCTAGRAFYTVEPTPAGAEDRPLQLDVTLAGSIRLCDPRKPSTAPDACRT